jgi:hypothetical protein
MTSEAATDAGATDAGTTDSEGADRAEVSRLAAAFFAAFTSAPDCAERLRDLRQLFLPGAIIVRTCGLEPAVYGIDDFIAPRQALLSSGSLADFREWEVDERTDVFGDIAQRLSRYAKEGVHEGTAFTGRGTKTLQFVRTSDGWRISAVAWDDERHP